MKVLTLEWQWRLLVLDLLIRLCFRLGLNLPAEDARAWEAKNRPAIREAE